MQYRNIDNMVKLTNANIEIGTPVTVSIGSDSYPYEVIGKKGKTRLYIQAVTPINKSDWVNGCETTEYVHNPLGEIKELTCQGGRWKVLGSTCYWIRFGVARYYLDPSF